MFDGSNLRASEKSHGVERKEKADDIKKAEAAADVRIDGSNILEAVGLDDRAETTGDVAESEASGKDKKGAGAGARHVVTAEEIAKKREELLKNLPTKAQLKKDVEKVVEAEIKKLHKKVVVMMRSPSNEDFYEMTNLVQRIRELKGLLFSLMKISFDNLKVLWLKVVHGIN